MDKKNEHCSGIEIARVELKRVELNDMPGSMQTNLTDLDQLSEAEIEDYVKQQVSTSTIGDALTKNRVEVQEVQETQSTWNEQEFSKNQRDQGNQELMESAKDQGNQELMESPRDQGGQELMENPKDQDNQELREIQEAKEFRNVQDEAATKEDEVYKQQEMGRMQSTKAYEVLGTNNSRNEEISSNQDKEISKEINEEIDEEVSDEFEDESEAEQEQVDEYGYGDTDETLIALRKDCQTIVENSGFWLTYMWKKCVKWYEEKLKRRVIHLFGILGDSETTIEAKILVICLFLYIIVVIGIFISAF